MQPLCQSDSCLAIKLNSSEQRLVDLLREASSKKCFSDPEVIIRFAGGWVRDKLLDKQSHDIDIALSTLTGHDFATQFARFLKAEHPELKSRSITKILANPDKSKHLDTATSRFADLDLDFVQLRNESYAADSRTPSVVGVGTLKEDAERRDCTMNALYYNVHSLEVEDPTEHGIQDLFSGRIQTPLAPRRTFLDDPLRVLRCIRFAAQFNFDIQSATLAEMSTADVRQALKDKVVKERVGIEVHKMLKGPDPAKALRILQTQQLYQVVFLDSADDSPPAYFDFEVVERSINLIKETEALQSRLAEYQDDRLWLLIALLPYAHQMKDIPKKSVQDPLACSIVREHLKLTTALETLTRATFPPRAIEETASSEPLDLVRLVRSLGKDWKLCLLVAHIAGDKPKTSEELINLTDRIHDLQLDKAWEAKCFINGKRIKPILDEFGADIKVMKELVERVVEYKLVEPTVSEAEVIDKLREYLRQKEVLASSSVDRAV